MPRISWTAEVVESHRKSCGIQAARLPIPAVPTQQPQLSQRSSISVPPSHSSGNVQRIRVQSWSVEVRRVGRVRSGVDCL